MILDRLQAALRVDGADEVEVCFLGGRTGATRFAGSVITQSSVLEDPVVQVRVAVGRRIGTARAAMLDPATLSDLGTRALALARHAPEVPSFRGFADPEPFAAAPEAFVPTTAALTPADRAATLADLFARAARHRLACAGVFVTGSMDLAVANSRGVRAAHRASLAKLEIIAADGDASGYAAFYGRDAGRLDAPALVETACEKASRMRDPLDLLPGAYDVVLEPPAVVESLEWMAMTGFGAKSIEEGMSFLAGGPGRRLTGAAVTWLDDATAGAEDLPRWPFDCEGVPKRPVVFVERGLCGGPCHDLRSAARAGAGIRSTGHAPPPSDDADGPVAGHVAMAAGDDSREALYAKVERGLLVTRFHYVNGLGDPPRALQTGMTRDGLFSIEHGKIGRGVRNLRWTEPMLEAFARMDGATRERQAVATTWMGGGGFVAPTVLLRGFHFTGKSR